MGYHVIQGADHEWIERPTEGRPSRYTSDLTPAAGLNESRARLWRLPPGTRGRRHVEGVQEEVFVVLEGTLTMLLGDPPERADVAAGGLVAVHQGTPLQVRNETDGELVLFIYGAPPVTGEAEFLDDVESI